MNRDCSGKLGLMLHHDEELSKDTISGPIAPFLLRLYERTYHRDLFTSLLIINDAPYRYSYRQPVAVKSTTSSATSFTSRDLRVSPWESQKEKIHVRRPARGKEGERNRVRERRGGNEGREWIGELEQRKLITRPVAFSWLDYLVTGERGERSSDWSSRERSFADAIFDFARPNGPKKFNVTECLINDENEIPYFI